MWPRNDGPGATSSAPNVRRMLSGFVAMMRRPDAERAAKDVDGMDWGGSTLRTSWGKLVPLPPSAIYGTFVCLLLPKRNN
jgi:U2-associated protein SR140